MDGHHLTKAEELNLARQALAGDQSARDKVLVNLYSQIYQAAIPIAQQHHSSAEDLAQVGILYVIEHFDGFRPELGNRCATYFLRHIVSLMRDFAVNVDVPIKLPLRSHRPDYSRNTTRDDLDRARCCCSLSLFVGADGSPHVIADTIADRESDADDYLLKDPLFIEDLECAMKRLSRQERVMLEMRLQGITVRQVALDNGMSCWRAERVLARIYQRLREMMPEHVGRDVSSCRKDKAVENMVRSANFVQFRLRSRR